MRRAGFEWTDEALEGVGRSARLIGADGALRIFDLDDGTLEAFTIVSRRSAGIWDEFTGEGLARLFETSVSADILKGQARPGYFLEIVSTYGDETTEKMLRLFSEGDPTSSAHILQRSTDPRDLFQWHLRGNSEQLLADESLEMLRRNMTSAEYDELKQTIFNRWNDGEEMPIEQLREAFGVEGPIWLLQRQYPGRYEVVWVNTKPGIQGPDAVLRDVTEGRWVIVEGKGTSQAVTELTGAMFPETSLGRQVSLSWVTSRADRYINSIEDPLVRQRILDMVDDLSLGEPYEVLIGRGGVRSRVLDYGTALDEFVEENLSPSLVNVRFGFITSP